ncbi:MAG: hypothetical protein D6742_10600 [Cyanobacteria bacterium J069]|nr:MAG: hypothetical protein D6742_10600 [Cyanobacteria bacterium J069]
MFDKQRTTHAAAANVGPYLHLETAIGGIVAVGRQQCRSAVGMQTRFWGFGLGIQHPVPGDWKGAVERVKPDRRLVHGYETDVKRAIAFGC